MEFKAFPEIKQIGKVNMQITQKIHGTNAQVFIIPIPDDIEQASEWMKKAELPTVEVDGKYFALFVGSRSRWITPEHDNYGFARHVYSHQEEFVRRLGPGQHFGEWAGPGINSGEGLTEKVFALFDFWKFPKERPLPPGCTIVPVLYEGPMDLSKIAEVMEDLKQSGSKLAPGFMRPEGIVITAMGTRFKKVFKAEETAWKKPDENYQKNKIAKDFVDCSHLLQPIRLEKLLSRDETYSTEYPKSLPKIVSDYVQDLIKEEQVQSTAPWIDSLKTQAFKFVRAYFEDKETVLGQVL